MVFFNWGIPSHHWVPIENDMGWFRFPKCGKPPYYVLESLEFFICRRPPHPFFCIWKGAKALHILGWVKMESSSLGKVSRRFGDPLLGGSNISLETVYPRGKKNRTQYIAMNDCHTPYYIQARGIAREYTFLSMPNVCCLSLSGSHLGKSVSSPNGAGRQGYPLEQRQVPVHSWILAAYIPRSVLCLIWEIYCLSQISSAWCWNMHTNICPCPRAQNHPAL